jgi:hypothetical protein
MESTAGEISPTVERLHRRLLGAFLQVFLRGRDLTSVINGASWMEIAIILTVRQMEARSGRPWTAGTKRTYLNALLGAISRFPKLWPFDKTNVIVKRTLITRTLTAIQKQPQLQAKATPAQPEQILMITRTSPIGIHAAIMYLLAARVQDYVSNYTRITVGPNISITYAKHKTSGHIGPRRVQVRNPWPSLITQQRLHQSPPPTIKDIDFLLKHQNLTRHSLRRGGLQFWKDHGLNITELMEISMHKGQECLLRYLQ